MLPAYGPRLRGPAVREGAHKIYKKQWFVELHEEAGDALIWQGQASLCTSGAPNQQHNLNAREDVTRQNDAQNDNDGFLIASYWRILMP